MANTTAKQLNRKKTVLYSSGQTPPPAALFFSSLQHMLLILFVIFYTHKEQQMYCNFWALLNVALLNSWILTSSIKFNSEI